MKTGRHQHGIKAMLCLTSLLNHNPNVDVPWGRPGLDGLTGGIDLILIKTEWYNTQDRDTTDFNKIDIVKPTPSNFVQGLKESAHVLSIQCPTPHSNPIRLVQ